MDRLLTAWWWVLVFVVALCASGTIQYGKGLLKAAPRRTWSLALPLLCLAIAVALQPWPWLLLLALLALAVGQLGYDVLLQALIAWVRRTAGLEVPFPGLQTSANLPAAAGPAA